MSEPVLSLRGVTRTYVTDAGELPVLKGVDLDIRSGELVALDLSAETIRAAEAKGFKVINRERLDLLNREVIHIAVPEGMSAIDARARLRDLAPGGATFPEFGEGHEVRIANLRRMVERAGKFGVKLYLLERPLPSPKVV